MLVLLLTNVEPPYKYNLRPDSPLSQYKSPDESDNAQLKSKAITACSILTSRLTEPLRLLQNGFDSVAQFYAQHQNLVPLFRVRVLRSSLPKQQILQPEELKTFA
jgi:hypothetical protein